MTKRYETLLLLFGTGTAALLTGCLQLRQPPTERPPEYMDTTDHYDIIEVEATTEPSATFVLNGKPFCFTGTNNYYLTYKSRRMVDDVLDRARDLELDVLRVWGYIDIGSLDNSVPSVDDGGEEKGTKDGVYFQYWDPKKKRPMVNTGKNGLKRLDYVLHAARKRGLKVIIVLTNNWHEFGGMDQYVVWYGLQYHHQFYKDEKVRQAFRNWIKILVNRRNSIDRTIYRNDPAIFAWELANEMRCRNNEEFDALEGCDSTTLVNWVEEMSAYIKKLDPNHMVAVGDEGFLNDEKNHWTHNGHEGVDHQKLSAVEHIDFTTFHLYPDDWGTGFRFGYEWIEDHLAIARELGKPTLMEEYGTTVKRDENSMGIVWGWERRKVAYLNWTKIMHQRGGNGLVFWMLAGIDDNVAATDGNEGLTPDYDHYTVYKDKPTGDLIKSLAIKFKNEAPACTLATDFVDPKPKSKFVHTARPTPAAAPDSE